MKTFDAILPGQTLGMLGGGQLGRFFVLAARKLGYQVIVLDPDMHSPAGALADKHLCRNYDDPDALAELAESCAAITTEFENIDAASMAFLEDNIQSLPSSNAIRIAQDRIAEKTFLKKHGLPTVCFHVIESIADIDTCPHDIFPAILKVSRFGYDGKGQISVDDPSQLMDAVNQLANVPCVLEQKITLDTEISVIFANHPTSGFVHFPVAENHHKNGILDMTIAPARISKTLESQAIQMTKDVAKALNYHGLGTVEMFVSNGQVFINEIAPRTHNSGHYTLNACDYSQFDLQLRTLCHLPIAQPKQLTNAVMVNLLGDIWTGEHYQTAPNWLTLMKEPAIHLSLYGKQIARVGRKMGHFTVLANELSDALSIANQARCALHIDPKPIR